MKGLVLVTSCSHSESFWRHKTSQLEALTPGDKFVHNGHVVTVTGAIDGRVRVDHPQYGDCSLDPMHIPQEIF